MLSHEQRIHDSRDFAIAMRRGRKFASGAVVFHLGLAGDDARRCGFIVSKAVGGSVVRHRVTRRLRHVCREIYPQLPPGARLVVRALPAAAEASYSELQASGEAFTRSRVLAETRR